MSAEVSASEEDTSSRSGAGAYGDYLAERDEILRHKWLMSEKAGHDAGFEAALLDWAHHHRAQWRKLRSRRQTAEK
jgi:hypothetical protein